MPNAVALLTLGKEMNYRDYAQGAYRMRGIATGQRINVLVVPEVKKLLDRQLEGVEEKQEVMEWLRCVVRRVSNSGACGDLQDAQALRVMRAAPPCILRSKDKNRYPPLMGEQHLVLLERILCWLLVNTVNSEIKQCSFLLTQDLSNLKRRAALSELLKIMEKVGDDASSQPSTRLQLADLKEPLRTFRENLNLVVPEEQREVRSAQQRLAEQEKEAERGISGSEEEQAATKAILKRIFGRVAQRSSETESKDETEQEQEQEQEEEKEQEVSSGLDDLPAVLSDM